MSNLEHPISVTVTHVIDETKFVRVQKEAATPECLIYDEQSGRTRPAFHEAYKGRGAEFVLNALQPGEVLVRPLDEQPGFPLNDVVQLIFSRVCWD